MSTLTDLLAEHTGLPGAAVDHLQLVVAEWQLLSDLSFADFLMWVPLEGDEQAGRGRFLCVAQARPTTAPTAHPEDAVGSVVTAEEHPQLRRAVSEARICREEDPRWHLGVPVRRETIPVRMGRQVIAVLSRDTNLAVPRVPSPLEISYLGSAADLCQMIADGTFPTAEPSPGVHTSPRVGDGLIRLDAAGAVVFASPNALSAYHRMGHAADLVGTHLAPLTRSLVSDPFDAAEVAQRIRSALEGQPSMRMEAEARGATVLFRALPLRPRGKAAGALVLCRDVTEVKRRDRALLSKDATIREIHHRVKNNLQTVAALLRLQSRRTNNQEARQALEESVRRVTSIALVHETLSMSVDERVDLDDVVDRVIPMMSDVAVTETRVAVRREGRFGVVPAEVATPLVMVLTELVQNAFEHAYAPGQRGEVVVRADRSAKWLDVVICDDGRGLPAGFSLERTERLGLQIVRTLVESELRGSLSLRRRQQPSGTEAVLRVPLQRRR
ncbi:Two-component sensor histidine kinase, contains HisKA and HATPase domains [Streptoalloteichus tenebrarius]|uniref:histidine kinase n=1 Tax=Streptoalloteichus tenebrarius (strain ATCC 17920 / DSM 40477 / JCM 4838 / CBS 697.72 / NBRC 16177 / NCIMB 11028 / NRRL B-12390 / A12253. 1 / ISP 5477) TaxID=1933 RepID=A0ABT1HT45_STRSD|nr:PAS domain-containing sensor histidine kinase [Streptoalloteichus tenebrarius]MCP2258707.1 Two-component sensor histidine kinase, contains HisKA and HATPase domains [Streptoalloteichus tenebrarius]BFF02854.1 PAS domain-containing sensor histidine kinase [Streptoalloteichus tenebrarius]